MYILKTTFIHTIVVQILQLILPIKLFRLKRRTNNNFQNKLKEANIIDARMCNIN